METSWIMILLFLVFAFFQKEIVGLPNKLGSRLLVARRRKIKASHAQYVLVSSFILGMMLWLALLLMIAQIEHNETNWQPLQFVVPFALGVILRFAYDKMNSNKSKH